MQGLAQLCCFLLQRPWHAHWWMGCSLCVGKAKETFLRWSYSFGNNSARQNLSAFLQHHTDRTDKGPRPGFVPPEISINNRLLYFSLLYFFLMLHPSPFLRRVIATGIRFAQSHLQRTCGLIFTETLWRENRENRTCIILSWSWKCSLVRVSPPSPAFKWRKTCFSSTALWLLPLWVATVT